MGFKVEINNILRLDFKEPLIEGKHYIFEKHGSRIFADTMQIWLVTEDWKALAEIHVTKQARSNNKLTGVFKVLHIYAEEESTYLTAIFKRMYGWE